MEVEGESDTETKIEVEIIRYQSDRYQEQLRLTDQVFDIHPHKCKQ